VGRSRPPCQNPALMQIGGAAKQRLLGFQEKTLHEIGNSQGVVKGGRRPQTLAMEHAKATPFMDPPARTPARQGPRAAAFPCAGLFGPPG